MQSVSFKPSEADLIAAYRLHFWTSLRWKRTVVGYALGGLVFAFIGTLFTSWDSGWLILSGAILGLIFWSTLLGSILAMNYLLIPPRSRRAYRQMKSLQSQTNVNWSSERVQLQSAQGSCDLDWCDFVRIADGRHVILLFQSDYLFNFVPKRAFYDEQAIDFLKSAAARLA